MKTIRKYLEQHKKEIHDQWLKGALEVYHEDTRGFYAAKRDRFANPVGVSLAVGLGQLLDGLIKGNDAGRLCDGIAEIIQMRSVQEMRPSEALAFLFRLKTVIRNSMRHHSAEASWVDEGEALESLLDATALCAFDVYLKYRERVFDIRVKDVQRQVSSLLKRTSFFNTEEESEIDG